MNDVKDLMNRPLPESEYRSRRDRLAEGLDEAGIDLLFVPPSSDLEYLTGLERDLPSFGQSSYAHGWVTGALIAPGREPLYVLPRMFVLFHLSGRDPGELVTVNESDDGRARFRGALQSFGPPARIGIAARTWGESLLELQAAAPGAGVVNATPIVNRLRRIKSNAELELMRHACSIVDDAMAATAPSVQSGVTMAELGEEIEHQMRIRGSRTPSFPTHIFSHGCERSHDSQTPSGLEPIDEGEAVMFDFGAVWHGYCSDFGRTVVCGEPPAEYERIYRTMLEAQEAGRAAAVPGARASVVNAACRAPIEDAGLGEFFRHRMGHGIGLDVHEQPFISVEDETVLETGMTFTDEPSILWDGHFAVRIEDIVVCAAGGGEILNGLSREPLPSSPR
ncbi:MAG: M24 family metallopeptidase [Gaiellaceae bacterium]